MDKKLNKIRRRVYEYIYNINKEIKIINSNQIEILDLKSIRVINQKI